MMKVYIGIDNGVTGSIAIITDNGVEFVLTPVFKEQSYTKTKQNISRINSQQLGIILQKYAGSSEYTCFALIERPMVNPGRFKATVSALRALEATLVVVENLKIPYQYIDSKEWQKVLLPQGTKGDTDLKKASMDIGKRLFPQHAKLIESHKDADGLLIAEYGKRRNL